MLDLIKLGGPKLAKARRSSIHGTGLFAKKDIPTGEKIIEYTGEKITKAEGNRRYDEQARKNQIYLFELNSRYDIDGSTKGNIAKYANHSCDPNAETIVEKGEIWLVALEDIKKGQEITFDYNFPLFDYEKRPCKCGSENCRSWIINRDSYNYLKRKKRAGKKGAKKSSRKVTKAATKSSPAPRRQATGSSTAAVKKTPKKATKKSVEKATKKPAKKATKKPAKKATKKPAKKATKKPAKKATKKSAKKAKKTAKKSAKKATKKSAKKSGGKTKKAAKKANKRKSAKKATKKAARR